MGLPETSGTGKAQPQKNSRDWVSSLVQENLCTNLSCTSHMTKWWGSLAKGHLKEKREIQPGF